MPAIEFRGVSRLFGATRAVDRVSLAIEDGEFFAMLGPSGSGKTTCLRLVAGFEQPDEGRLLIHGADAGALPPYARDVNTVFQDYALFPHMSVLDNVAYGPMVRGVPKRDRQARAERMLELVQLPGFGARRPAQLSGGQRQRVALARALINEPRILLLDEPLGALDLKLREQMQAELRALQRKLGITFVFVTHDQGEALSMADRVAVFDRGRIEQVDSPRALYGRPRTPFVAQFVGTANVFEGAFAQRLAGSDAPFAVRPERVRVIGATDAGTAGGGATGVGTAGGGATGVGAAGTGVAIDAAGGWVHLAGRVLDVQYQGALSRVDVQAEGGARVFAHVDEAGGVPPPSRGEAVTLAWPREAMLPLERPAA